MIIENEETPDRNQVMCLLIIMILSYVTEIFLFCPWGLMVWSLISIKLQYNFIETALHQRYTKLIRNLQINISY